MNESLLRRRQLLDNGCPAGTRGVQIGLGVRELRFRLVPLGPQRAELLLAGLPNCSLRKGDMYALPFDDAEFDTVILDDVLATAELPAGAVAEARRLLRPGGRLLFLSSCGERGSTGRGEQFAGLCADAGLRLAQPRLIPARNPLWLLAVATPIAVTEAA